MPTTEATIDPSRQEVDFLGKVLGEVIRDFEGEEAFQVVEQLRIASRERRSGREPAAQTIGKLIAGLDAKQMRIAIRAFSVLLDLMNVVEDRRRVRVLAERARSRLSQASQGIDSRRDRNPSSRRNGWRADSETDRRTADRAGLHRSPNRGQTQIGAKQVTDDPAPDDRARP